MTPLSMLHELKMTLEEAAFLVSTAATKEAHSHVVKALVLVSRLEEAEYSAHPPDGSRTTADPSAALAYSDHASPSDSEREEVEKVRNRLRLWSRRPHQINTRILRTYLELERSGVSPITEARLRSALPASLPFDSNFAQMKITAERNHGKVFESQGGHIAIWPPVAPYVRQFEREQFPSVK